MRNIFAFCNQKGGVGKTTSVINVASVLAESGFRTLIIDLDPQANATSGLGVEKPDIEFTSYQLLVENTPLLDLVKLTNFPNLNIIPSNADVSGAEIELVQKLAREFRLKNAVGTSRGEFDFILLDCPPSLGMITVNAITASDYVIIPLQCEYYALEGLGQLLNTYQLIKNNLNPTLEIGGVILTMADFRTNLTQQVIEEVKAYFKDKVFDAIVPRSVKLSEAPSFGKPAVVYDPANRGSKTYRSIAEEFIKRFSDGKTRMKPSPIVQPEPVEPKGGL